MTITASGGTISISGGTLTAGAVPVPVVPFQYWRLRTSAAATIVSIYEIAMIDTTGTPDYNSNDLTFDSADVTIPTATEGPFADSIFNSSFDARKAFDNNLTTRWNGDNSNVLHHIGWNFGSGNAKDIKKMLVRQAFGTVTDDYVVEKSNDGSAWTFVKNITLTSDADIEIDLTV